MFAVQSRGIFCGNIDPLRNNRFSELGEGGRSGMGKSGKVGGLVFWKKDQKVVLRNKEMQMTQNTHINWRAMHNQVRENT